MVNIHPTAVVAADAELGVDVQVGPFCVIEAGVRIGDGTRLASHVIVRTHTTLGAGNLIDSGAVLGGEAQDLRLSTQETFLVVGDHNIIREYVTIHRSNHEGGTTRIGDHNLLMAFAHLGHDVVLGNHCQLANQATLGGHCQVDDRAVIGGMVAIHQWTRIGTMAMVGGRSGVNQDVPPFTLVEGVPAKVLGINVVGLRRNGIDADSRALLKRVVREVYTSRRHRGAAVEELAAQLPDNPHVRHLLQFVEAAQRGRNGRQLEG